MSRSYSTYDWPTVLVVILSIVITVMLSSCSPTAPKTQRSVEVEVIHAVDGQVIDFGLDRINYYLDTYDATCRITDEWIEVSYNVLQWQLWECIYYE